MQAPGRLLAGLAGAAQLLSGFLAWSATGTVGLDIPSFGRVTVALVLVLLAAVPMVGALVGDSGWPRLVAGLATGVLVLAHLGGGPDGEVTLGVVVAALASVVHLVAAALASGPLAVPPWLDDEPA